MGIVHAMRELIAAVDCGTTAIKAAIMDLNGRTRALASRECPLTNTRDHGLESDPRRMEQAVFSCLKEVVARSGVHPGRVAALAVSNQRATVLCTDRNGSPIGRAISWQDMRGIGQIEKLRKRIADARYSGITGLPNNPVFTLAKILWIKETKPALCERTSRFVLVHDYMLKRLGCRDFLTDWSNASLTGILDITRFKWSREILDAAGFSEDKLPELVPPGSPVGVLSGLAAKRTGLRAGMPLVSGGGDQQCAAVGSGAVAPGVVSVTLGTAAAPLCAADSPVRDPKVRVTTCAHAVAGQWTIEGLQTTAGAGLEWIRRFLSRAGASDEALLRQVARVEPGSDGVFFFPYFTGASAPRWNAQASAMFLGLRRRHAAAAGVRAVLEGIAMETREILEVFSSLGYPPGEVRLTGGYSSLGVWNQIYADVLNRPVSTLRNPQASLLGAAILAACGIGAFPSVREAVGAMVHVQKIHRPEPGRAGKCQMAYERSRMILGKFEDCGLFETIAGME